MRFLVAGLLALHLISCGNESGTKIRTPEIDSEYFSRSVSLIEEEIAENPEDTRYIKLQLSFYEKLGWPPESEKAIERARRVLGLDPVFINQQIEFYQINGRRQSLLNLLRELELMGEIPNDMKRTKIRIGMALEDYENLRNDLKEFQPKDQFEDYILLAEGFLVLSDTSEAIRSLKMAMDHGRPDAELVPTFMEVMSAEDRIEFLSKYMEDYPNFQNGTLTLAQSYYELGDTSKAKQVLSELSELSLEEHFQMADWYTNETKWDSAYMHLSQIIREDSTNDAALMAAGDVNQNRGYFNSALFFYGKLLQMDSTNQKVKEQIDLVNRKIAYLRRIREAREEIPMLNLDSKRNRN